MLQPDYGDPATLAVWKALAKLYTQTIRVKLIQTTFPTNPFRPDLYPYVSWWLAHIVQYSIPEAAVQMALLEEKGTRISLYHNGECRSAAGLICLCSV